MNFDPLSFVLGMGFVIVLGGVLLWLLSVVFAANEEDTHHD